MPMTFKVKVNSPKNDSPSTESKVLVEKDIIVDKVKDYNEVSKKASSRSSGKPVILQNITLNNKNLMEAIIYSEILGKPKCKRRGRCR
jgi:hypothetical protein